MNQVSTTGIPPIALCKNSVRTDMDPVPQTLGATALIVVAPGIAAQLQSLEWD